MKKFSKFLPILIIFIIVLAACNKPSGTASPSTEDENTGLIHTIAAQTVEAQMTLDAASNNQEPPPDDENPPTEPTATFTPSPTNTQPPPPPTNTPQPTATNTPIPCDQIAWGKDVTIPDNTELVPGEIFTKTWRLKNAGTCTWNSAYSLIFDSGDSMNAPATVQLTTGTVAPGQEIDISVILTAPDDPGTYQGFFKFRNPGGAVFGLGAENKPFWVKVKVPELTGVMFDFIASYDEAEWGSGVTPINFAGPGNTTITPGGPDTDTNGFVMIKDGVKFESNDTTGKILETHPKWENDGYIIGRYPTYKVGAGDEIKGRIGFIALNDGSCGAGDAIFQIRYTEGDDLTTMTTLGEWEETCDGTTTKIEIDLTSIKGKTVRFYLIVLANGVSTQDWAIWSSLGVFR